MSQKATQQQLVATLVTGSDFNVLGVMQLLIYHGLKTYYQILQSFLFGLKMEY